MHIFTKEKQSFDFEQIYIAHFSKMKRFAVTYVLSEAEAENIVQDIFLDLWEHRAQMTSHTNLVAHLFTAVKNKCIDYLRHQITAQKVEETIQSNHVMELQMKFESLISINALRDRFIGDSNKLPALTNMFATKHTLDMREEIRRERRVEMAAESFRYDDLIRWKTADLELVKPILGARFDEKVYPEVV